MWVLYAAEENERLARAATAAFAVLTEDVDANRRIFEDIKSWPEVFKEIAMHEDPEVTSLFLALFSVPNFNPVFLRLNEEG